MKRLVVRIVGVVLVVGALGMLALNWGDAHRGSSSYMANLERDASESAALAKSLEAKNAPAEEIDAAYRKAAQRTESLAYTIRARNEHNARWQEFYEIIAAVVLLGLVVLYFGFRKPRATAAA